MIIEDRTKAMKDRNKSALHICRHICLRYIIVVGDGPLRGTDGPICQTDPPLLPPGGLG